MKHFLGDPQYKFLACDFGFPTKKKTYLWGNFTGPEKQEVNIERFYKVEEIDYLAKELFVGMDLIATDHSKRAALRSITPPGFANAFFKANQ